MDTGYAGMNQAASIGQTYAEQAVPANALDHMVATIGSLEDRLRHTLSFANGQADRIFCEGGVKSTLSDKPQSVRPVETGNVPTVHGGLNRLHQLAGELDEAVRRFASL